MPAERLLPTPEAEAILELVRDVADRELSPRVARAEAAHAFPRDAFATLGELGLLAMPLPDRFGGGDLPYEVYLQVLEEIADRLGRQLNIGRGGLREGVIVDMLIAAGRGA